MSSQDGSNRSQRSRRTSPQQRQADPSRRQSQTWDVDPAEIDRYLSGRPTRSEESASRSGDRGAPGNTRDQLSKLQNAVGRRPGRQVDQQGTETYRAQPVRREQPRREQAAYDDDEFYDDVPLNIGFADDDYGDEYEDEQERAQPAPRRRPEPASRHHTTRSVHRAPRYEPDPAEFDDDAEYDDELYNDDPFLGYEDEEIDRRERRPQRPRQQPRMTAPSLPKVTIPKSLTDSPLLADRSVLIMLGIALASIALMAFIVTDRINLLGETIPTHVSASGDPENLRTREAVWNIPLLAGMVMLMNTAASWVISRIDRFAARFLMAGGLLVHFIAWVALFKYLWE